MFRIVNDWLQAVDVIYVCRIHVLFWSEVTFSCSREYICSTIIYTVSVNPRHVVRAGCHNSSTALKAVALLMAATGFKWNECSLVEESFLDSRWNIDIWVYSLYFNFIPESSSLAFSFLSFISSMLPLHLTHCTQRSIRMIHTTTEMNS